MTSRSIAPIAVVGTAASLFLRSRDGHRIMRERKRTAESAEAQLSIFRKKVHKARDGPDAAAVPERSGSICRQAAGHYDRTLRKPWIYLPAALTGPRMIQNGARVHDLL